MSHLFVYGSLRPGENAESLLGEYTIVQLNQKIIGYRMYVLDEFPIVAKDPTGEVWGDVLNIDETIFHSLDKYEETEKNIYLRSFDETYNFFIYTLPTGNVKNLPEWKSGNWKR